MRRALLGLLPGTSSCGGGEPPCVGAPPATPAVLEPQAGRIDVVSWRRR